MRSSAVIGYARVSTSEQRDSGLGIEAQRSAITAEAARRGWDVLEIVEDAGYSAKDLARPGMARVLDLLRSGAAGALVVAKLDRATRSTMDAASLLSRAKSEGWAFVALDLGVNTGTPTGELVASVMAAVSQWERRAIGQRTKEALEAKREQGVALGRPAVLDEAIVQRILAARSQGKGWTAIASELDEGGVPTAHGGAKWYPSTVRAVVRRHGDE
jgi:DNA invertase Pin-like site-specific DNA recombinase